MSMNVTRTDRGFEVIDFVDRNQQKCSLQQSSAIGDYDDAFDRPGSSAVWLGKGAERMHLGREEVEDLLPHLVDWLNTGSLVEDQGGAS